MITLQNVKILLTAAGISRLKIDFNDIIDFDHDQEDPSYIKVEYVFRGVSGSRRITYQEIKDSLTIGPAEQSADCSQDIRQ